MNGSERPRRLITGNEYLSIPGINTVDTAVETLGVMHSALRACVELRGSSDCPLLQPFVEINGQTVETLDVQPEQLAHWIPRFRYAREGFSVEVTYFAPLERRGFVCVVRVENTGSRPTRARIGWQGCWDFTLHTAILPRWMAGTKHAGISEWMPGVPVFEFRGQVPLLGVAFVTEEPAEAAIWTREADVEQYARQGAPVETSNGSPVFYRIAGEEFELQPGESRSVPIYIGVGTDEVSAAASADNLRVHGHEKLLSATADWLERHRLRCEDGQFDCLLNRNSFYCYFFSQALTIDAEELVVTPARSSRNKGCACYRDRDAMRWTLPAVLQVSSAQARKVIIHAFTEQLANVGVKSRFIDGTVLEPGIQLDQLCAPIRALQMYVQMTDDLSVLFDRRVQNGVNTIQQILGVQRHPEVALFETLLLPSGNVARFPYICFSNVLAWRILLDIGWLYDRVRDVDRSEEANALAALVKEAITQHFVVPGPSGRMFAFGIDLQGNFELGDDPAGSLKLLSYLGFCQPDDPVYRNTVEWINAEVQVCAQEEQSGSEPAVHTGGMPLICHINDLLCGRQSEALEFLSRARLDDGVACEFVDPVDGSARGGEEFASLAGLFAFALRNALNAGLPEDAAGKYKRAVSETLYHPPPTPSQDSKKARL